jgi:hypothetical protein
MLASSAVIRAFTSWSWSILAEIYLCYHTCSCHEISRMETPGQATGPTAARSPPKAFDWAAAASPSAGSGGAYDLFQYVYKSANQKDDFTPFRNNFTGDWATVSDTAAWLLLFSRHGVS